MVRIYQYQLLKTYDKHADLYFSMINFSFLCSYIPESPAYNVFILQTIRYSYLDFLLRGNLLTLKLLRQGYRFYKVRNRLKEFYGRHHELTDIYNMSVSQTITGLYLQVRLFVGLYLIWCCTYSDFDRLYSFRQHC